MADEIPPLNPYREYNDQWLHEYNERVSRELGLPRIRVDRGPSRGEVDRFIGSLERQMEEGNG